MLSLAQKYVLAHTNFPTALGAGWCASQVIYGVDCDSAGAARAAGKQRRKDRLFRYGTNPVRAARDEFEWMAAVVMLSAWR